MKTGTVNQMRLGFAAFQRAQELDANGKDKAEINKFALIALHSFLLEAIQGDPNAMFSIGLLYSQGLISLPDDKDPALQALIWFIRAEKLGNPNAKAKMAEWNVDTADIASIPNITPEAVIAINHFVGIMQVFHHLTSRSYQGLLTDMEISSIIEGLPANDPTVISALTGWSTDPHSAQYPTAYDYAMSLLVPGWAPPPQEQYPTFTEWLASVHDLHATPSALPQAASPFSPSSSSSGSHHHATALAGPPPTPHNVFPTTVPAHDYGLTAHHTVATSPQHHQTPHPHTPASPSSSHGHAGGLVGVAHDPHADPHAHGHGHGSGVCKSQ